MKGLLDRIREIDDCGRCLEDMDFGESSAPVPVSTDVKRLKRIFG